MKYLQYLLIIFPVFILSNQLRAQTPGGIAAGNTMWLRGDAGVTLSGTSATQWQDISAAGVTGNFTVQPIPGSTNTQAPPIFVGGGNNFNPYLYFNGITASMTSVNSFAGTSLVSNSNATVLQVFNLKGGIVWMKWETDQQGTGGRLGFENAAGDIRADFPNADPPPAGRNVGVTNVLNKFSLSTLFADASTSVNRLNGANDNTISIPAPGNFSSAHPLCLGNDYLLDLPAQIYLSEIIIYSRTLSAAEINKIETYLAVKYGFTLDQSATGANNYTATDGTVIWNNAGNTGYEHDITGIGRDDAENLLQKQSKSNNTTALVTLYNGSYSGGVFPATNVANSNGISADRQFLLIGDNGAATTLHECIFNGKGERISRVWKVNNTGLSSPVTYSVDQSAVEASVKNIIVSTDPTFPPASTVIHPLTAANGKLYTDLLLNNNDYFTYASDTIQISPVVTPPTCANPNSGSIVSNTTGGATPLTYLWQPTGQTTPDITNIPANTYTLTVSQGTCSSSFIFTITPVAAPAAPMVNNAQVCNNSSATLTVQSPDPTYIYNWYTVATGGTAIATGTTYTTPALTTTATYYVDATNGACTGPRTAVTVTVITVNAPTAANANICSGSSATLTVQGPDPTYTYNWYVAATGGTPLATGTSYTTPALTTTTIYYVDATSGTCTGPRTAVTVTVITVNAATAANASTCSGSSATLSVQSPDPTYTYNWYAAATGGTPLATGTSYTTPVLMSTTTYYVEAVYSGCSTPRTAVTVTTTGLTAPAVNNATVCSGTAATLSIQSPDPAYTYHWYAAATGGTALATGTSYTTPVLTTNTTYYAEAASGTCTGTRSAAVVTVTTVPSPVVSPVSVCAGTSATLVIQSPNPAYSYQWYNTMTGGSSVFTGSTYSTPPVNAASVFYAEASDGTCSSTRASAAVSVIPVIDTPAVVVSSVTSNSVTFSWPAVSGASGYLVSVNGGANIPLATSVLSYSVTGLQSSQTVSISVIASGAPGGCGDSDPGHATAETYNAGFYVPSAFTPNGDHNNDVLFVHIPGNATLEYFTVYNRWGQKIFSTSTTATGWDGTWSGKDQPNGIYVWICSYRGDLSTVTSHGTVMLFR